MRAPLAVFCLLLAAGCDTTGADGICRIGDQPALNRNRVETRLEAPVTGDTLRLGEPFALRGHVRAAGPDIVWVDARLTVALYRPFESGEPLLTVPLARADGDTAIPIDRELALGRLRGGLTSLDLADDESVGVSLSADIRYPVTAEGAGCGTTLAGSGAGGRVERVTVLLPR